MSFPLTTRFGADPTRDLELANKQYVDAGGGGGGGFSFVYKTADETINSDTTLTDDADLLFPVDANSTYIFFLMGYVDSNSTADYKQAFSIPAGATAVGNGGRNMAYAGTTNQAYESNDLTGSQFGSNDSGAIINHFMTSGVVITGGTAGNVVYQWAQNTSDVGDTVLKQGSAIMFVKVS